MSDKPQPRRDPLNAPFWDHAERGVLAVQTCLHCGDQHFPPSPICPRCNHDRQEWRAVSGRGTLESWVTFHRAYWPGFADELPYDVCLVRLEEGPLLLGNFSGPAGDARLGAPVTAVFQRVSENVVLPQWQLTPTGATA